ncbi:MAG: TetR/AcrR family transcriptional regulator [Acidimicrobiales bacterium]
MPTAPTSPRRLGTPASKTREQLVGAAEKLLLEEGYAAVTSRRVAAKAGLKPQLVHYYFRTMDDLFLEVYRRRADENLARFERAMAADGSLRTLWRLNADPHGASFNIEFVALAKHRKAVRSEIAAYAERFRAAQLEALTAALAARGVADDRLPPVAVLLLMTGVTQVLALEEALGMTAGHAETIEALERLIDQLDPPA